MKLPQRLDAGHLCSAKPLVWAAVALLASMASGCANSADDPAQVQVQQQQASQTQIQSIQSNTVMPAAAKQRAIEGIKAQESRKVPAPLTEFQIQQQQVSKAQIQSIENNPNMPAAAKQRAIEGMKAQQSRLAK